MAQIGQLNLNTDELGRIVASGSFRTIKVALRISLIPNGHDGEDRRPTHTVYALFGGEHFNVGVAWCRRITRGENNGSPMFSMVIDDPSFDAPLNLSAFPTAEKDLYEIVWRRPRGQSSIPSSAEVRERVVGNGAAQGTGGLDDEIPF